MRSLADGQHPRVLPGDITAVGVVVAVEEAADERSGTATEVEHTHAAAIRSIAVPADRTDGAIDEVQRGSGRRIHGHLAPISVTV